MRATPPAATEALIFTARDGVRLVGERWLPDGPAKAVVALAHGYGEHVGRYVHVVRVLLERGYAVWTLDHRGHGRSEGPRAFVVRFDDLIDDFDLLVRRAVAVHPGAPIFVLGHSMGGLIAVRYALRHQADLAGLATSGAALVVDEGVPALPRHLLRALAKVAPGWALLPPRPGVLSRDPAVEQRNAADPLNYKGKLKLGMARSIVDAAADARRRMDELRLPLLVMHGADDRLTSPTGSRLLYAAAHGPDKTLKLWPGLRHEIFNEPERDEVLAFLGEWLDARVGG